MTERTRYLRHETVSGRNKRARRPLPPDWTVANEPCSLPERKAKSLAMLLERMPIFIGEEELIVGTRTLFKPAKGNEDGHDTCDYSLYCGVPYINDEDIRQFGKDQSWLNKTHYTPDLSILLKKGVDGILGDVALREKDPSLTQAQREFLASVKIAYCGLKTLILRYADRAQELAVTVHDERRSKELREIETVCRRISGAPPETFREAVQLLWIGHLVTIIESHEFINYGRLDVILGPFLKGTPQDEALELLECLLLKMYDQVDIKQSYLSRYAAQLVVTLGGILPDGSNAVNDVTMLFLQAIDGVRLPEPEFNLRVHSKNPPEFLERASQLTVTGCNFVSYYNDDLFIDSMVRAGIPEEIANDYGFDLCQDINFPGRSDLFTSADILMANELMKMLLEKSDFATFEELCQSYKERLAGGIEDAVAKFNRQEKALIQYRDGERAEYFRQLRAGEISPDCMGRSPMCPLPYLSGLFHGAIETAADMTLESYPVKDKGLILGTATECVNSLAAIRKIVYDEKRYSLTQVVEACKRDWKGEGDEEMRTLLWNAPKWGNDEPYVDEIAKDVLEFGLRQTLRWHTASGGRHLAGIHQPHPVTTGEDLMATPEGRHAWTPVAVTLTPESGTMRNGPTAALCSGAKIDHTLVQWNYCVMVNYFASVFHGNDGACVFRKLLKGYFDMGGMQHQPNVLDVAELRAAQLNPEQYKDLIVRLWGVSAHFVDLPRELQDEMIARFE